MNPMKKPVASVLRLFGAGWILLSVVLLILLWIAHKREPEPLWRWTLYGLPAPAGMLLCIMSSKLAARLTRNFEE